MTRVVLVCWRFRPAEDGVADYVARLAVRGAAAVGGDTGPLRLVVAAGLPVVGLFGPTLEKVLSA